MTRTLPTHEDLPMPSRTLPLDLGDGFPPEDGLDPEDGDASDPSARGCDADLEAVWDALCFVQAPVTVKLLAALLAAAHLRTARGAAFHPQEVRGLLDALAHAGRASMSAQGRWQPKDAHVGWARFRDLIAHDDARRRWWEAWKVAIEFGQPYRFQMPDTSAVIGALRVVVHAGGTHADFGRLHLLARDALLRNDVLRAAFLEPFDAALMERMEPRLRWSLVPLLLSTLGGDAVPTESALMGWLYERMTAPTARRAGADAPPTKAAALAAARARIAAATDDASSVPEHLRLRVAEWLVGCERLDDARRLFDTRESTGATVLRAAADIAQGHFDVGAAALEGALKTLGAQTGKRKNLLPPSLAWLYPMALLHRPEPAAWTKARKFVAGEAGKREADPASYWGIWHAAIDQRMGDAVRDAAVFRLSAGRTTPGYEPHALPQLHHLLLACWCGVGPLRGAQADALRSHVRQLSARYDGATQQWLAGLARRAGALLVNDAPDDRDAKLAFFVGPTQDRWRDALNSILALGEVQATDAHAAGSDADRLIWAVTADARGRITAIEPLEQKAGARGLGKPKAVTLAALTKRTDLPAHDAAVLRAARRDTYMNRHVLDPRQAAQALVRHPCVAWSDNTTRFVDVVESLPALEVMTRGEHIQFRVIDPIRPAAPRVVAGRIDIDDGDIDDGDIDDDDLADDAEGFTVRYARARPSTATTQPPVLLLRDGPERARLLRVTPAQLRVAELVTQGWQVPVGAKAELEAALRVLSTHFQVASDAEAGTEVPTSNVLRAEMVAQGQGIALRVVAAPFGDFGPRLPPGGGRERVTAVHQGVTLFTRRDLAAERDALSALTRGVEFLDDDGNHAWDIDEPEQALAFIEALAAVKDRVVAEWPKGKPLHVRTTASPSVKLNVSTHGEWFDVDGEIELDDGQVLQLRRLLDVLQEGRSRFVALGDGGFLALSEALRRQLADLKALAQPHAHGQRLSAAAAAAWSSQVETGDARAIELAGDAAWRKRADAWAHAQSRAFDPPRALLADLRDYQREGYAWLARLAASGFGGCLADDMGLGKTLQTLALLIDRAADGPALVVAPTSVCGNWLAEAARFAPSLEVMLYGSASDGDGDVAAAIDADESDADAAGDASTSTSTSTSPDGRRADAQRRAARKRLVQGLGAGQVLVCSYAMLQLDADVVVESREWHTAVLDEAQAIKNAATRRARAACALRAGFRLALSGTPIENRLGELWSIMAFANPGLLGSAERFGQRFAAPIERGGDPQAARRLRRLISPFLLRRTKTEVLTDLPPRTEIVHEVVPGARERALLEALRQQAEDSIGRVMAEGTTAGQAQIHVLAALTKLRRAACDPRLVAPELALIGAKVQEFERLAQELVAGRHKALVFSQFTDFLALLRERLDGAGITYQYLDGSTPAAERTTRVAAFQAGTGDFFLISLKAGGFGLNLTAADYVIITDPWWNPAAEDQASGRAHRIGQQRPVTVYRLVTKGSIEDRIVRLHHRKRELADGILSGQDGGGAAMGAKELMALLSGDGGEDAEQEPSGLSLQKPSSNKNRPG